MLIIKNGKRETNQKTELSNEESIRILREKGNYKYIGSKQRWKKN